MEVVFLLGNGFDLNCGLKSSYNDMYEKYCASSSATENIAKFKSEINHNISKWSDFEKSLGEYGAKVHSEGELLECARDFKRYLSKYLASQNEMFAQKLKPLNNRDLIIDEFKCSLNLFYDNCGFPRSLVKEINTNIMISEMNISIISFNYTNTFETLNNCINPNVRIIKNGDVIHIHGELSTDDIVLGVDNIDQIHADYITDHRFERGLIKPVFNDEYDKGKINRAVDLIEHADVICSFGMSFGITDNTWKKLIIDSLQRNGKQILIFYDYGMSQKENMTIDQKMDESDEFKRGLSVKWEIDIPEEVKKRIYVPCGKNIFNIEREINAQIQREMKIRGISPTPSKAKVK